MDGLLWGLFSGLTMVVQQGALHQLFEALKKN